MIPERRSCLRHKVHGPVFASFDGVTGGMILDLSEQGVSMQTIVPLEAERRVQLRLDLPDSDAHLETTGYVAWADALGRAGVRFSELPVEARQRLDKWLAHNEKAPSRKAPKLTFDRAMEPSAGSKFFGDGIAKPRSVSLEAEGGSLEAATGMHGPPAVSSTIQYEFNSLGPDLNSALRVISERARTLLRGSGAAIALSERGPMMCRASVGVEDRRWEPMWMLIQAFPGSAFAGENPCAAMTAKTIRAWMPRSAGGSGFARWWRRRSGMSARWWGWWKFFPRGVLLLTTAMWRSWNGWRGPRCWF